LSLISNDRAIGEASFFSLHRKNKEAAIVRNRAALSECGIRLLVSDAADGSEGAGSRSQQHRPEAKSMVEILPPARQKVQCSCPIL